LYVNNVSGDYHPLCKSFIQAANEYGINFNADFNGANQEGVGYYQITTKNGRRMSAARAYLHPATQRANCQLVKHAHVTRILFDKKIASSVVYLCKGQTITVNANREVILSAGAINTPQLLQLSGVGPQDLLNEFAIPAVHIVDAVGKNMQEHLACTHYYKSRVPTLNNQLSPWWGKLLAGMQYLLTRHGLLSLSVNQSGGFVICHPHRARANLQLYFAAITYSTAPDGERPLMRPDSYPGFLNCVGQLRPRSRGYLNIKSTDPLQHPSIQPNYYSHEDDIVEMLEGMRLLRALAKMPALSTLIETEYKPGLNIDSDDELIDYIRQHSTTVFHPTSTCMMGPVPQTAVVDNRCRVYGLGQLRIVDASVFPTVTSGNTNAPVMMLAEKAADLILSDQ
jgi:choline dehydrogenase